jgi:hypothetical protein
MANSQKQLWKVKATVEPKIEWEKIGIESFKISADECVAFVKQLENQTQLYVTAFSNDSEVHNRAEFLMKAFLGLLGLESHRHFDFKLGVAHGVPQGNS